jgi:WD40 repeat protein
MHQELLGAFHLESPASSLPSSSTSDDTLRISGFRSLAVRPDGRHLAAGDRGGNLRVYELGSGKLVSFQEAHDSEILTLSYSESGPEGEERGCLLASGGRDRLIHLYDVSR